MTRDRAALTAAWLVSGTLFLRYWDLTIQAEAILVWTGIFALLFVGSVHLLRWRGLGSPDRPWPPVWLWGGLFVVGSLAGLTIPSVPIGGADVQTVALLRVFDVVLPLWVLLRGVRIAWHGRTAILVTSTVPFFLLTVVWWINVRMPGESHTGPLPAFTEAEAALAERLEGHVVMLANSIGARGSRQPAKVNATVDYLGGELRAMGYTPRLASYPVGDRQHLNLEVTVQGGARGEEIVVVGAHYDTYDLTPGADDNASGVAGVLELARMMVDARPERTVRLVLFGTEEPPYFNTENMGSRAYARELAESGDELFVMISLETIGFFLEERGSQHYPPPFHLFYPDRGDFIGIVGNPHTGRLTRRALEVFRETTAIPSEGATPSALVPGSELSDHSSFWKEGFRALLITDAAPFRNPHYHEDSDTPETLDFERMARVVMGTREIIRDFAGG